jgi:hypothetical protein
MTVKEVAQKVQRLLHPETVPTQVVIETAAAFALPYQELDEFSIEGQIGCIKVKVQYQIVKPQPPQ